MAVEGVYELPKAAVAIAEKVRVYWSAANSNVTTTASGNTPIGHSVKAHADREAVARIRLSQ